MSRFPNWTSIAEVGFPRVSGDEPAFENMSLSQPMFSPRERG